jgi:hypothetical protein
MVHLNQSFGSIPEGRNAINRWLLDNGESYSIGKSKKSSVYTLYCKAEGCTFSVRLYVTVKTGATITKLEPHICSPDTHYDNSATQSVRYLADHHRSAVVDNRQIKVTQLISSELLQFGNRISYQQAWRVKENLLEEIDGHESESYPLFQDYLRRIHRADIEAWLAIKRDSENHFQAFFVSPGACRKGSWYMRRYFGFDATHTHSKYPQMLMICCGLDANEQIVPLAWGLVPTENGYWWEWFCKQCKHAFECYSEVGVVMISDRDKGLKAAISNVFPNAKAAHCCQHIADNIQAYHGGVKTREKFWQIARAKTSERFEEAMLDLQLSNIDAYDYVNAIPHDTWAYYVFPHARYGQDTSNINESLNQSYGEVRHMQPLQMLNTIYHKTMTMFYERSRRRQKGGQLADVPLKKFEERQVTSQRYKVHPSDDNTYQVETTATGEKHTVHLDIRVCQCTQFDEYNSPCAHGIAALRFVKKNPYDYFDKSYTLRSYRNTYAKAIPPVSIEDLVSDNRTLPPIVQKKRGRPAVKRIRKSQLWRTRKSKRHCAVCGSQEHDKRNCNGQPLRSGKAQRARDRAAAIAESASESESEVVSFDNARARLEETDSEFSELASTDSEQEKLYEHYIHAARDRESGILALQAAEEAEEAESSAFWGTITVVPHRDANVAEPQVTDTGAAQEDPVSPLKVVRKRHRASTVSKISSYSLRPRPVRH